jgi:hypothetical protein
MEFVKSATQKLQAALKPLDVTVDVKDISVVAEIEWRE